MSHNAANSQRPSRGEQSRKSTDVADTDRRISASTAPTPSRDIASPPPGSYPSYSSGYHNPPPAMHAPSHFHQHPPPHQGGAHYPSYATPPTGDAYGYAGPSYHSVRHTADSHQYSRPRHSQSHSSGSGSSGATHDIGANSHYAQHYTSPYPAVSSTPPVGHSARTRWAWVPIEVPQAHLPDDAHLQQYAPYPGTYYPSQAASAPHSASTSHASYQYADHPQYGEHPIQGTPAYGVQSTPPSYAPSYPYHLHPSHYGPHPPHLAHTSHSHVAPSGRGSWSGSQQPAAPSSGGSGQGSRRTSNQPSRSGSSQRRTSSNSSGNHSASSLPGVPPLPHRPEASKSVREARTSALQPSGLIEEDVDSESALASGGVAGLASDADAELDGDASMDAKAAERVPGSGLRPHYHPQQGPRSEWVLWCGNVPQDATVEELWEVFSRLSPDEYRRWLVTPEGQEFASETSAIEEDVDDHGVLSIFIISRSNCAFVNYATSTHLDRAAKYFQGKQTRPRDPRCPKLVCRVRKKDDEAQAGVAGQRGRGIHVAWLKQQRELERAQDAPAVEPTLSETPSQLSSEPSLSPLSPYKDTPTAAAGLTSAASYSSSGSTSYASTNSSLFRHPAFRQRFFILKSLRSDDLDRSVETGYWATQPHNEDVLDQAYRNSETVFLIFGVNQTGEFHGYAKMAGPIHTSTNDKKDRDEQARRASQSSMLSMIPGSINTATIPESVVEDASEPNATQPPIVASPVSDEPRSHPILGKSDIEAARGLFGALTVAGLDAHGQPMTSPLPITPSLEEGGPFEKSLSASPQRNDTITPQNADTYVQSSTWPYTSVKSNNGAQKSREADSAERPKLSTTLSADRSVARTTAGSDEHGVRRIDMETEAPQTASSLSDPPSLAPSDSASWSSADPRMAEQIALRAVIHNLRLDEMESRGQAEKLESKLRSNPGNTDDASAVKSDEPAPSQGDEPRSPPRQSSSDSWGKPFRVEWIRTDPLPFQRVKKLRNPWRDNRQVKVSRDGTELEPGVGRQLLEEWNRLHAVIPVDSTVSSSKVADPASSLSAVRSASDEDE